MQMLCPAEVELSGYSLGILPDDRSAVIDDHLEDCRSCQIEIEKLSHASDELIEKLSAPQSPYPYETEAEYQQLLARVAGGVLKAVGPTFIGTRDALDAGESYIPAELREYRLQAKLGEGGMGAVYQALHTKLDKTVALKILPSDRMQDAKAVARFEREMKAVGKLDDPHIVRATDAGEVQGTHFLVMEFVDGTDLSGLLKQRGPFSTADACEIVRQAAVGLQHAHKHGLVHRDIKPSNLMLTRKGDVKLLDLGLALLAADVESPSELTHTDNIMGTADYISPEQIRDTHAVDIRADLYSLGCTLFKLLTGRAPFEEPRFPKMFDKLTAHTRETPPALDSLRADAPPELSALVARLLAKDAADRFQTPQDLAEALQNLAMSHDLRAVAPRTSNAPNATGAPETTSYPVSSVFSDTVLNSPLPAEHDQPPTNRRSRTRWIAGAMGAMLLLGAIVITTSKGKVTIDIPEKMKANVAIKILDGGETVALLDKANNWTVKLAGGKYQLDLQGGSDEFNLEEGALTVSRFGTTVVNVKYTPADIPKQIVKPVKPKETPIAPSRADYALSFDGVDDYVSIPTLRYGNSDPVTLEITIRSRLTDNFGSVIGNAESSGFAIDVNSLGKVKFPYFVGETYSTPTSAQPQALLNEIVRLAAVANGKQLILFADGKKVAAVDYDPQQAVPSNYSFRIGASAGGFQYFFAGEIDEVRLSNTARYSEDYTPKNRLESDNHTLALYHFDEGTGQTLHDASGNNHTGTIRGAEWVNPTEIERLRQARSKRDRLLAPQLLAQNVTIGLRVVDEAKTRTVSTAGKLPAKQFEIVMADISRVAFVDDLLPTLAQATEVKDLRATAAGLTPTQLTVLAPLKKLSRLTLDQTRPLTNELLQVAANQFADLKFLSLASTKLPATGLPALTQMSSLRALLLGASENTDIVVGEISSSEQITYLNVVEANVSWPVLSSFLDQQAGHGRVTVRFDAATFVSHHGGGFTATIDGKEQSFRKDPPTSVWWGNISGLDLSNSEVSTAELTTIGIPYRIKHLSLANTKITDGLLRYIRHRPQLERIDFSNTGLTDCGLLQLSAFPAIKSVDLRGTQATTATIAHLKQSKPNCEFLTDFSVDEIANAQELFTLDVAIPTTSPFDSLKRAEIDPYELKVAGDDALANAPPELVGIFGDSRLRHGSFFGLGTHFAFTPDSRQLIAADLNGRIVTWDVTTGRKVRQLRPNTASRSMFVHPKTGLAYSFAKDLAAGLSICDFQSGAIRKRSLIGGSIVGVSADGNLAVGGFDGGHCLWHVNGERILSRREGQGGSCSAVAMQPAGRLAAVAGYDGLVTLWDVQSGKKVRSFHRHSTGVHAVTFSPSGRLVASGSGSNSSEFRVSETDTGKLLIEDNLDDPAIRSLAFAPDGQRIAVGLEFSGVWIVKTATGEILHRLSGDDQKWSTVGFSPDGQLLAASSTAGVIKIWNAVDGTELHTDRDHTGRITSTSLSEDGKQLASADSDGNVTIRDTATGKVHQKLSIKGAATAVAVHSRNNLIVLNNGSNFQLNAYSLSTGELLARSELLDNDITAVAFTHDGSSIVVSTSYNHVFILDPFTLAIRKRILQADKVSSNFVVARGGRQLISFPVNSTHFNVIDTASGRTTFTSPKLSAPIRSIDLNADGTTLAVTLSQSKNSIRLWDLKTMTESAAFGTRGRSSGKRGIAFHPTGQKLYVALGSGQIQSWNLDKLGTDEAMTVLQVAGPRDGFYGIHIDPAGTHLITHNVNDTIFVLRLNQKPIANKK